MKDILKYLISLILGLILAKIVYNNVDIDIILV